MNNEPNYIAINQALWNAKTPYHVASAFYDNEAFINGAQTLKEPELQLLGDVSGLRILHLQCHFGQDSLSLARMGASITGVDFSEEAIANARKLNEQLGLGCTFICADVYNLPEELNGQFDIVFTSYGTIVWLPSITKWAKSIARCLKPGGRFVFAETHPLAMMYDDNFKGILYSYFNRGYIEETEQGTYADRSANIMLPSVTWNHTMADVVQSLINEGLAITQLHEYDYSPHEAFGNMVETSPGKYEVRGIEGKMPLTYTLEAKKLP